MAVAEVSPAAAEAAAEAMGVNASLFVPSRTRLEKISRNDKLK